MGNHSSKAVNSDKKFSDFYSLREEIGCGTFASVRRCRRKCDSAQFAVKIINKRYLTTKERQGLENEVHILQQVSHANIIKLIDVFENDTEVFMVLELCDSNDLFDELIHSKHSRFSEKRAAKIVFRLCNALEYLHSHGIVHRDLKPENIMMLDGKVKIADFGLGYSAPAPAPLTDFGSTDSTDSIQSGSDHSVAYHAVKMDTCCGTPHYVAPEIIVRESYGCECDLWSLGVILYVLLSGCQPFRGERLQDVYNSIVRGDYELKSKRWSKISKEGKDLVRGLLNIDPTKRYSAKQVKHHVWIKNHV